MGSLRSTTHLPGYAATHGCMSPASLSALQVQLSAHRFAVGHRELPFFRVMIRVDEAEDGALHVAVLRAAADVEKIESDGLAVGRNRSGHARPISCVAIVGEDQAIAVDI